MAALNSVVIGTGFIGPVHVEALRRAGITVRGIVGSTPAKSRTAANQLGLPDDYGDFEGVIADKEIDVVHLATPNRLHFAQASAALWAGKHVLCEKPLAMSSTESAKLVQIAAECQRAAGVAYNIRYYPLCLEAAARNRNGQLGDLLHVHGSYVQDWLFHETDFNWRVLADEGGELRAVADVGTHWLDLVQFITGRKVTAVCADLRIVHPVRLRPRGNFETFAGKGSPAHETEPVPIDTEDCGTVMLRFDNGANGCLWVSQTTAGRKNCVQFEMTGNCASLAWNSQQPEDLWIGYRDRPNELLTRDPALISDSAAAYADFPGGHVEGYPDTFKQLFRSFYDYIAAGDLTAPATFPTFADGHHEILLCDAIRKSHRKQQWVEVSGV